MAPVASFRKLDSFARLFQVSVNSSNGSEIEDKKHKDHQGFDVTNKIGIPFVSYSPSEQSNNNNSKTHLFIVAYSSTVYD